MAESNLNKQQMQKISYEAEMQRRGLGKMGLFDTQGGKVLQGIGSTIEGFGQSLADVGFGRGGVDSLQRLGLMAAQNFNQPSDQFIAEQERLRDNISGVTGGNFGEEKPSMGNIRPEEIQSQIDILNKVPGGDPLTVDQINELYRKDAKGGKFKPFPTDQARQVKDQNLANKFGSGAADTATAQNLAVGFKKEKAKEQIKADANREASLDMSDDPTEQLFAQAMSEFIKDARTGTEDDLPEVGDIKAYKKKFAEATGVDISGKPDTSQALMAMGLSMMQNRAGKGFDVGKIFNAVGEAGEKALPALTAAKAEARANQVAAGKYALDMESKDETKREAAKKEMSTLGQYFILPKGDGVAGSVSSILDNKGSYETISKGELQQLMKNPEFASKYDVLPGSMYKEIMLEAMATPEAEENWLTKTPRSRQLMAGIDDPIFNIEVFVGKPGGKKEGQAMVADKGQVQNAYRAFAAMDRDNERLKEKFLEAGYLTKTGAVNVGSAIVGSADSFLSAFGINFKEGATDQEKLDYILNDLKAGNASRILGESGKTISDGDRLLVESIVGNRTILSNPDELEMKLNKLFTSIYTTANNQVMDGLQNLDAISGQNVAGYLNSEKPLTKEEQEELRGFLGGSLAAPRYETDTPSLGRGQ